MWRHFKLCVVILLIMVRFSLEPLGINPCNGIVLYLPLPSLNFNNSKIKLVLRLLWNLLGLGTLTLGWQCKVMSMTICKGCIGVSHADGLCLEQCQSDLNLWSDLRISHRLLQSEWQVSLAWVLPTWMFGLWLCLRHRFDSSWWLGSKSSWT